tara:strand:- start:4926 stop:5192 length:267 start_codon:yes stop_codon:yes gene_type:complete
MSNTEKIYVGNGVEKFDGDLVEFSLNLTKLKSDAGSHIFDGTNGDKYIRLKVVRKRNGADDYGKTHYVEVNTFKPEPKKEAVANDLPF